MKRTVFLAIASLVLVPAMVFAVIFYPINLTKMWIKNTVSNNYDILVQANSSGFMTKPFTKQVKSTAIMENVVWPTYSGIDSIVVTNRAYIGQKSNVETKLREVSFQLNHKTPHQSYYIYIQDDKVTLMSEGKYMIAKFPTDQPVKAK